VFKLSSKLFANMNLNIEGQPMQLLAAMLPQDREGEGAGVAAQAVPPPILEPILEPMPDPDQPQDHFKKLFKDVVGKLVKKVKAMEVLAKVGKVAYRLELPQELSRVHHTFHVSNLKKCYADEPLVMPLEGIHVDDKLQFVEEPVEIMEREIKRLKRSRIPLVKVRWNSRRGPEFTWEREDSFKQKYPQLFTNRASSSTTRS
ncbi:hypothetical protein Tco_1426092, partial [Tanacetum coccineum]